MEPEQNGSDKETLEYTQLLTSLGNADRADFRRNLGALAQKGLAGRLEAVAAQSERATAWSIEIFCKPDEDPVLRTAAFHAVRLVGPRALAALREAWDREQTLYAHGRIHMCMMDIVGRAGHSDHQQRELTSLAEEEISRWIETLGVSEPRVRAWAIMMLVGLVPYAPANLDLILDRISESLQSRFPTDDDPKSLEFFRERANWALKNLPSVRRG